MKTSILKVSFLIVSLLSFAVAAPGAWAANHCSYRGVAGEYGFTLTGVLILPTGPVPISAVGRVVLDAAGNASGTESRSVGGGFADETFTGTYTVNPDCTSTTTLNVYESGQLVRTSVLFVVFDSNQTALRMVQKSLQLPDGTFLPLVITVEGKRIFTE